MFSKQVPLCATTKPGAGLPTWTADPHDKAKGILMARDRCNREEAFEVLRRISQNRNVKLRDIAQAIGEAVQK